MVAGQPIGFEGHGAQCIATAPRQADDAARRPFGKAQLGANCGHIESPVGTRLHPRGMKGRTQVRIGHAVLIEQQHRLGAGLISRLDAAVLRGGQAQIGTQFQQTNVRRPMPREPHTVVHNMNHFNLGTDGLDHLIQNRQIRLMGNDHGVAIHGAIVQ